MTLADRYYGEQSYAAALRAYRTAVNGGLVPAGRRPQVEYRMARSLGMTRSWDTAFAESFRLTTRYGGTIWEARTRAWLMQLYQMAEHSGWKVGERYYRGSDVPNTDSEAAPEAVDLTAEDLRKSLLNGELAQGLYEKVRSTLPSGSEEARHSIDLANVVLDVQLRGWASAQRWKSPEDPSWELVPAAAYSADWAPPKKGMHLLLSAERVAPAAEKPEARLAQAAWLRRYHELLQASAWREVAEGRVERIPYPYEDRIALGTLRSLVRDYPAYPRVDRVRFMVGQWLEGDGKYLEALKEYQALVRDVPKSPAAEHAAAAAAQITRLSLSLSAGGAQAPGKKATLHVSARNVPTVRFAAYRVRLEEMVRDPRVLSRPVGGIGELFARLGKLAGVRKFYKGDPVRWETALPQGAGHRPVSEAVQTPLTQNGAYVVEAEGGPVRSAAVLLVSDLAAFQLVDEDRAHAMVVNAETGAPVMDARVLIREVYDDRQGKARVSAVTAETNAEGQAGKALVPGRQYSGSILTFAWKGDRYAFTDGAWQGTGEQRSRSAAYVYSDRPVYRPSQKVFFRALLASRPEDRAWKPLAGKKVRVRVSDPRGAELLNSVLTAGEFGSVNGSLPLGAEPPLGEYGIVVTSFDGKQTLAEGSGTFRVEEYKKPEFEVTVKAGQGYARVGEPIEARVTARYYFGAPVPGAKVRYRVQREEWFPPSPFSHPYAFLYPSLAEQRSWPEWRGEWVPIPEAEVLAGEALTDAKGELRLRIPTALKDPRLKGRHLKFTVHAEVTDASRRTIEGQGEVRALATQFNAFVEVRKGFYAVGDRLTAAVRTVDADGKPVAASGTGKVVRVFYVNDERREEPIHQAPVKTDADGRGTFDWTASRDGQFELRFEARDAWEEQVVGSTAAWVSGEGAGVGLPHDRHVTLIPESLTYRIGEKARLLIVADEPGGTVLLTQEAGSRILDKRVVRLTGRSQIVEIPLTQRLSPDVTVAITGVRKRVLVRSQAVLYVPPAEHLLNVQVTADRPTYEPGEKATFRILARDVDGRPVRLETSVGVVDASVFYIQSDQTPPLAPFFYAEERGSNLSPQGSLDTGFDVVHEDSQPPIKEPKQALLDFGTLYHGKKDGRVWAAYSGTAQRRPRMAPMAGAPPPDMDTSFAARGERRAKNPFEPNYQLREIIAGIPAPAKAEAPVVMSPEAKPRSPEARVRKNFADTAFWSPAVVTDNSGVATVEVTWPDNLTQWRATARGWSENAQVGEATADVETSKDLLVRLQAPRFFVERDEVVLSANVHNYTDGPKRVRVSLDLQGDTLAPASAGTSGPPEPQAVDVPRADRPLPQNGTAPIRGAEKRDEDPFATQWVEIPAEGEQRVDWRVRVERPGEAKLRVAASAGEKADAMELSFPVFVHGVEKLVVRGGSMLGGADAKSGTRTAKLKVQVPAERAPESGELIVQVTPSVAAAMLDALPYVVDYPYGCTEQTMSRFLPCVVSAKTLKDLGVSLEDLRKRAALERDRFRNSRPQDRIALSGYTYPAGSPGLGDLDAAAERMWTWRAEKSPVYNPVLLKAMVAEGLSRLKRFQNQDGGWGWWEKDSSSTEMTAYVLQGLTTAKAASVALPAGMLERGFAFLEQRFPKETDLHDLAYQGWVLSLQRDRAGYAARSLKERVFPKRAGLTAYGLAHLAMAFKQGGLNDEARICLDNLENTATVDKEAGTCSWRQDQGAFWFWHNNDVETAATCLRAFNAIAPKHALVPMVVRWLTNNRRGDAWDTTKETSLSIQALAEYVKQNRELSPDYTVTVDVGGRVRRAFRVTAENALLFDNRLVVPGAALQSGTQEISITRQGKGNLYYSAYLRYFTLEEGIRSTGNEIQVRRRYFRLIKAPGGAKPAGATADGYVRSLVRPGERLGSGDLLEVELLIESKNAYQYLVFEDMKPAGCEPVELRSGGRYGNGLCSNMELRDEKVAFFVTYLPQGRRSITYRLRAEIPGAFHALPLNGYAMYAPEVRCISDEGNFEIEDGPVRAAGEAPAALGAATSGAR